MTIGTPPYPNALAHSSYLVNSSNLVLSSLGVCPHPPLRLEPHYKTNDPPIWITNGHTPLSTGMSNTVHPRFNLRHATLWSQTIPACFTDIHPWLSPIFVLGTNESVFPSTFGRERKTDYRFGKAANSYLVHDPSAIVTWKLATI
jgi:hypothetical protein